MTSTKQTREGAQAMAIQALGHIAADPELLPRFLAITGIDAGAIRQAAREPGFLAGVLQFMVAHEPTLMRFCEENAIPPQQVSAALRALPFGVDDHDRST